MVKPPLLARVAAQNENAWPVVSAVPVELFTPRDTETVTSSPAEKGSNGTKTTAFPRAVARKRPS